MKYLTYCHSRNDNGEIFYIGLSSNEQRPYSKHSRNRYWKNVANKYGYSVRIIKRFDTREEAANHEKELIQIYKDAGCRLVNLSTGGEYGAAGVIRSNEFKAKVSNSKKGVKNPKLVGELNPTKNPDVANKISIGLKAYYENGGISPTKGIKRNDLARRNSLGLYKGETHGMSKQVEINGVIFSSITEANKMLGISKYNIRKLLSDGIVKV